MSFTARESRALSRTKVIAVGPDYLLWFAFSWVIFALFFVQAINPHHAIAQQIDSINYGGRVVSLNEFCTHVSHKDLSKSAAKQLAWLCQ